MKQIIFGNEHFGLAKRVCGVYRITFNDKWFYIGSSVDIKRRLVAWKHYLGGKSKEPFRKNRSIMYLMPQFEKVNFEIIELVSDGVSHKSREDFYIKKSFENELCLNLIPDAVTGKGRKLPMGVIRREKKKRGLPTPKKPVAVFDLKGKLIMKCESIMDASKKTGVKEDTIRKIFTGKGLVPRRYVFKPILEDGSVGDIKYSTRLTPEMLEYILKAFPKFGCAEVSRITGIRQDRLSSIVRGRVKGIEGILPQGVVAKPKAVVKMDLLGNVLENYTSINSAAKSIGVKTSAIQDVLYNRGRFQVKGFKFKFKDEQSN